MVDHDRPLFRGSPLQSAGAAAGAAVVAVLLMRFIPATAHVYSLMQTAVAILAIACMAVFVVMHHRQEGRFLSQTQEEMILIGAFGLACLAVLVATRAWRDQPVDIGVASQAQVGRGGRRPEAGFTGGKRPYPCSNDAVACVVEEWSWF